MITVAFIVYLAVGVSGYLIRVPVKPTAPVESAIEDLYNPSDWIYMQKAILPLFENVCEDSTDPTVISNAEKFDFNTTSEGFKNEEVIINLRNYISTKGLLAKGEIFSEYNKEHLQELKIIYDVLYNAVHFETFYKFASWGRQNLNCGLFVNVIYLAILRRKDTQQLSVPGPFEVLPNYFLRKDVIVDASALLAGEIVTPADNIHEDGNMYTLDANYTSSFYDNDQESKMSYFFEDIGLNTFYFFGKLQLPTWDNNPLDENVRYGEYMYHMMKQLSARYDLERYSNGFMETEPLNWEFSVFSPYDPMLIYSNGNEFNHRTSPLKVSQNEDITFLQDIESNLGNFVGHMVQRGFDKNQILNYLIEILVTSDRNYETVARRYLGQDTIESKSSLSVLQHHITSLRDPEFWKLNKKMVQLIDKSLSILPSYSRNELYFPGVEISNIEIKKFLSNFDLFDIDVTESLKTALVNTTFRVKVEQTRLNHKTFSLKVNISSLVNQKGMIKIYLGPKILPGEFASKKNMFMLIDMFEINLKTGNNIISKTSLDMKYISEDFNTLRTLRKIVEDAESGLEPPTLKGLKSLSEFPSRFILPKGTQEGLPLQLFIFVAPFIKPSFNDTYSSYTEQNSAIFSLGYPLDLTTEDNLLLSLPNSFVKNIIVTHKGSYKVSSSTESNKGWYNSSRATSSFSSRPTGSNNYSRPGSSYSSRPDFTYRKDETYDYNIEKTDNTNKTENILGVLPGVENSNIKLDNYDDQVIKGEKNGTNEAVSLGTKPVAEALTFDILGLSKTTEKNIKKHMPFLSSKDPKHEYKSFNSTTDVNKVLSNKTDDKNLQSNVFKFPIPLALESSTTSNMAHIFSSQESQYLNQDSSEQQKTRFDYKSKRFDYKSKKAELEKNIKKNKTVDKGIDDKYNLNPTIHVEGDIIVLNDNSIENDSSLKETNSKEMQSGDIQNNIPEVENTTQSVMKLMMTQKRKPSVYDYIVYSFKSEEDSTDKVYE